MINIKLKEASKNKISGNFRSVLEPINLKMITIILLKDFRNSVSVNGTLNKFNYLASFGNQYTDGLSAIANGTETDAFNSINGNLKLGYQISESFKLNTLWKF